MNRKGNVALMGGGGDVPLVEFWWRNLREIDHLVNLGVDEG